MKATLSPLQFYERIRRMFLYLEFFPNWTFFGYRRHHPKKHRESLHRTTLSISQLYSNWVDNNHKPAGHAHPRIFSGPHLTLGIGYLHLVAITLVRTDVQDRFRFEGTALFVQRM